MSLSHHISEEVVDIFAAAGLDKPDLSILSDEFLEEIRNLPQKNLALELMRRLLNGRIRYIAEKNVVQAKKFSEMLEASVIQYQKRSLETAEVIQALVDMARDMNEQLSYFIIHSIFCFSCFSLWQSFCHS